MPIGILIMQGIIFSLLSTLFILMPSVNHSFWILSNLTAELALSFYILLFAAAIRLSYKYNNSKQMTGLIKHKFMINFLSRVGIITCVAIFFCGLIPPQQIAARFYF